MKSIWVKSMCKKGFWVKSLWVKNIAEHRDRWDASFRSPLLRLYIYIYINFPGKRRQTVCSWDSKGKGGKDLKSSVSAS